MTLGTAVAITKVTPQGRPAATYTGHVLAWDSETVVARCLWNMPHSYDLGPFQLDPGDVFTEFYYRGRWFNVFQIEDSTGRLKGWYCNITRPPEIESGAEEWTIRWYDLALDLLVLPDGSHRLLDEDEFEALAPAAELRIEAERAVGTLLDWLGAGRGPFRTPAGQPAS